MSISIARSIKELERFVEELERKDVTFSTADGKIDLSLPNGKMHFQLLGVFAEFERNVLSERTKAGLEAAKARGQVGGRPKSDDSKHKQV